MASLGAAPPERSQVGAAVVLVAALLACGGANQHVVEHHERVGATPPPDGPRVVGPLLKGAQGQLHGGVTVAHARTLEEPVGDHVPSQVITRRTFRLGYAHGVSDRIELGGSMLFSHSDWGTKVARDLPTERLESRMIWGGYFNARGLIVGDDVFTFGWLGELGLVQLPFHERIERSVDGGPFEEVNDGPDTTTFLHFGTGLLGGAQVAKQLSLGLGLMFQTYPAFITARIEYDCDTACDEQDDPDVVRMDWLDTGFAWITLGSRPVRVTAHVFRTLTSGERFESSVPVGGGLTLAYVFDFGSDEPARPAPPEPEPEPAPAAQPIGPYPYSPYPYGPVYPYGPGYGPPQPAPGPAPPPPAPPPPPE